MKKLIIIAIFMVSGALSAQIKLTGTVKDTIGSPLEMANVIAIDTVTKQIGSYGFSDAQGKYKLDLKKNTVYNIKISYVGLKSINDFLKTGETDMVKNYTMQNDNMLDEIQIVSKMPVTVKGDTIIYNADSFKNGTERKLEDVLKKLPGVEINDDGQIEVEGKTVEKVMVDGKDFFDGDSKLATKNIPSNAVDKIQVLRNFGDVSQLRGVQDNQDRVALNIKLKKGKENFWFGDVTVGAGDAPNEGLYLFQPKLFYYTPKYTLNVIGDINNIGDVVLNRRDVRNFSGGFRSQSPSNGTNINIADGGIGFLTANARNSNRIETQLGALNFSYSPSKKLDLSGFLIWSGNSNGRRNISNTDFIDPSIPDDVEDNITDQTSNTALAKFSMIYKKDINNQMNYDVIGRFSNEFRNNNISSLVVGNNILERENATPFRINQNLSYFYTASEKSIFALEVQHLLQDEDPFYVGSLENNSPSGIDGFDEPADDLGLDLNQSFYRLNQNRRVQSNQVDAKLDYYYILNDKSNLNFVGGTILSRQNFDSRFFQVLDNGATFDPTLNIPGVSNPRLTNDTEYNFTDLYAGLRYRVRSGIFTFRPGFTLHSFNVNNTQFGTEYFEDKFFKVLPEVRIIAQFKRSENLTFQYRQQVNFTDVNQIAQGIIANNYSSFFFGNNELQNAYTHNLRLDYRSFNLFNNINMFGSINYVKTIDQIANAANFVPGSVISTSTSLNLPFDTESLTAFGFISKTWGKWRARFRTTYNYTQGFQLIGPATNEFNLNIYSFAPSLNTNFRKAPNITLRYTVNFNNQETTSLASGQVNNFETVTHIPSVEFDAYIWNSLTVKSDFLFNEVKQDGAVQNRFKIWNFSMGYRKDRDAKWEYEIRANNILGTDSQINISNGAISNRINEQFILPRFITARVIYSL
jgi:hypothetical protein